MGADASVKAQGHEATRSSYSLATLTFARSATEWEMIDIIVAVKSIIN